MICSACRLWPNVRELTHSDCLFQSDGLDGFRVVLSGGGCDPAAGCAERP
jgi:hypothetical protein